MRYLQQVQEEPHDSTEPAERLNFVARHLTTGSCLASATSYTHVSMTAHFIVDCTLLLNARLFMYSQQAAEMQWQQDPRPWRQYFFGKFYILLTVHLVTNSWK